MALTNCFVHFWAGILHVFIFCRWESYTPCGRPMAQAPFVAFKVPLSEVSDTCTIIFFLVLCAIRHERWVSVFFFVSKFELLMILWVVGDFMRKGFLKEKEAFLAALISSGIYGAFSIGQMTPFCYLLLLLLLLLASSSPPEITKWSFNFGKLPYVPQNSQVKYPGIKACMVVSRVRNRN